MGSSGIKRRKPRRRLPEVGSVAAETTEKPTALTYEGMNARVGSFGAGYRSVKNRRPWSANRLGGLTIRVLAVVILAGVLFAVARMLLQSD